MLGPLATTNLINVVMFVRVSVSCVVDDVKETPMTRKSAARAAAKKIDSRPSPSLSDAGREHSLRFLLFNSLMIILQCEIKPSFDLVSSFFFFSPPLPLLYYYILLLLLSFFLLLLLLLPRSSSFILLFFGVTTNIYAEIVRSGC